MGVRVRARVRVRVRVAWQGCKARLRVEHAELRISTPSACSQHCFKLG